MAHKLAPATHFSVPDIVHRVTDVFNHLIKRYFSPIWWRNQNPRFKQSSSWACDICQKYIKIYVKNAGKTALRTTLFFRLFFIKSKKKHPKDLNEQMESVDWGAIWQMRMSMPDYERNLTYHTWIRFYWFSTTGGASAQWRASGSPCRGGRSRPPLSGYTATGDVFADRHVARRSRDRATLYNDFKLVSLTKYFTSDQICWFNKSIFYFSVDCISVITTISIVNLPHIILRCRFLAQILPHLFYIKKRVRSVSCCNTDLGANSLRRHPGHCSGQNRGPSLHSQLLLVVWFCFATLFSSSSFPFCG